MLRVKSCGLNCNILLVSLQLALDLLGCPSTVVVVVVVKLLVDLYLGQSVKAFLVFESHDIVPLVPEHIL